MKPDGPTAENLLHQAKAGNHDALGQLLEMYRGYIGVLARLQIDRQLQGKVSPSDVVQDTFLNAKRGFSEFRGQDEAQLVVWLRQILVNRLADLVRRYHSAKRDVNLERTLDEQLQQSSQALVARLADAHASPSASAVRREEAVVLADLLNALPADYREVLVLRHLEGLSFSEVALRMGRTEVSVKNIWARALAKLRSNMGETA